MVAKPEFNEKMLSVLRKYQTARSKNLLLTVPFVTIGDYLHELRAIARLMHSLGPDGLLYLAAAASDFFLPQDRMAEHKIQSTDAADKIKQKSSPELKPSAAADEEFDNFDSSPKVPRSKRLIVDLDPVPKFLKNLVDGWAPQCMIVSFKLETDPGESQTFVPRRLEKLLISHQKSLFTKQRPLSIATATTSSLATCCPRASGRSYLSPPAGLISGFASPAPSLRLPATRGRSVRWKSARRRLRPCRRIVQWIQACCQKETPTLRLRASLYRLWKRRMPATFVRPRPRLQKTAKPERAVNVMLLALGGA